METYDPLVAACRFGIPSLVTCKLCGTSSRGIVEASGSVQSDLSRVAANACPVCLGVLDAHALDHHECHRCRAIAKLQPVSSGTHFATEGALSIRLAAWAQEENFRSLDEFLSATFVTPTVSDLFGTLQRRARIETVVDPFGVRTSVGAPSPPQESAKEKELPAPITERLPRSPLSAPPPVAASNRAASPPAPAPAPIAFAPAKAPEEVPPPSAPPRSIVYPLVSVISADGEVHPAERAIVDRFLHSEGLLPLSDDEFRVHSPADVAHLIPKERREAVIQLMCETSMIDGMPDASEIRVIRAYAAAWNVPEEKLDLWLWAYENAGTSAMRQLWLKIRRFVLSARWEERSTD